MRGNERRVAWVVEETPQGTHVRLSMPVEAHLSEYRLPGLQSDLIWFRYERLTPYDPEKKTHGSHFLESYGGLDKMLQALGYKLVDKEPQPESWIGEWLDQRLTAA